MTIGLLVGLDGSKINIFLPVIETMVTLDAGTGNVRTGPILFESDDCSGKPYTHASYQYSVIKACDKLYTGKRKAPRLLTLHSMLKVVDNWCECVTGDSEAYYTPAVEVPGRAVGL